MAELPSGAVTFLFTDVERSTHLVKQLRDRYPEVLADHRRLLRDAFAAHRGHEIDTQGDAFFVAFASARDAVLAAIEGQRKLAQHAWPDGARLKVRIGIHTGQASPSEGTYTGVAVHRAARVSAAGHGGQILISQTTHNLLEDEEEDVAGVRLRDLGEHQLKDLDRPVRVYQVEAEGLETEFPALRTAAPSPAAEPAPPHYRRRTILVGALAGVIAAAVAIPIFALGGGGGPGTGLDEVGGNGVGVIQAGSGAVEGEIEAPAAPTAVAAGLGYVWLASADANAAYAIDADNNSVRDSIAVDSAPGGIAVGGGSVWVTNSLAGTVSQLSPEGFEVLGTIQVRAGPTGVAVGGGYVWVANTTDQTVSRIPASGDGRVRHFTAGPDPSGIAVGAGAVWVASKSSGVVIKLSRKGGFRGETHVGDGPAGIVVGAGAVWVANSLSNTVSKIDPQTGTEVDTIEVGEGPSGIAVAGGKVWTANELAGTVSRIDPATGVATEIRVGGRPTAVAAGDGVVYVALRPTGEAHRGGTLTAVYPSRDAIGTLDPAVAYQVELLRVLSLTNDGLLTYRRVGGQPGYQLVPDLAISMPVVSEDGKTYTFELRPEIRYSNGRVLRASDVRYSLERVFRLRPGEPVFKGELGAIRGAGACGPKRCDLSDGIITDDATRTVTFRLSEPDPIFLYKLAALFASVVPTGTPLQEATRRPLPATGPYRVASFTPKRSIRLVRNPYFREWSRTAQPAGFPDEIVLTVTSGQKAALALVQEGKADLTSGTPEKPFAVPAVFRPQLRTYPLPWTFYLALNPTKPPFDDVRARRAVNYALDRSKVVQLVGGEETRQPTCQILPPNFPGYRRYCPYTLDADPEGSWSAPDLDKALRLVAESGTAGTPVTLWFAPEGGPRLGRYLGSLLESLGYRARVRSFASVGAYFASFAEGPARPQILWSGWAPDYPAASNFIQLLFSCSSDANFGHFCDRAVERRIDRALKLQEDDLVGANRLWADTDRELVDKAAWVPLYNLYGTDFVSKRVGNYQYNPQFGALLSQMWVR